MYVCVCFCVYTGKLRFQTESMHYPYAVGQRHLCGNENGESRACRREKRLAQIIKSACTTLLAAGIQRGELSIIDADGHREN